MSSFISTTNISPGSISRRDCFAVTLAVAVLSPAGTSTQDDVLVIVDGWVVKACEVLTSERADR